jgi:hypothetical protein
MKLAMVALVTLWPIVVLAHNIELVRVAVAEPVLHQMKPQHGHQRIRRTTASLF